MVAIYFLFLKWDVVLLELILQPAGLKMQEFFADAHARGTFYAQDIFQLKELERSFDIIICHDVFEHIDNKKLFLSNLNKYLKPQGIVFMSFPAWQMPFGGHQQICQNPILSRLPFVHLLPMTVYRGVLKAFGENGDCIKELLSIKRTRVSIESFESMLKTTVLRITNRQLWLINPHYQVKFGLSPTQIEQSDCLHSYSKKLLLVRVVFIF